MGGHGGLNILPQKRWNVYNFDNREKVRKDEEEAAREEQLKREQSRKRDTEVRLERLRTSRGLAPTIQPRESDPEPEPESKPEPEVEAVAEAGDLGHINLFEGIKIFDPIRVPKREYVDEKEEMKKKTKKLKLPNEQGEPSIRAVGPEDEKYRLGHGVAGKGVQLPWYAQKQKHNDDGGVNGENSGGGGDRKGEKRKKTLEELREERLKREKKEKEREMALRHPKQQSRVEPYGSNRYYRCHQLGKDLLAANCNACHSSSNLATCIDCSIVLCDGAGHLDDHIKTHPSHQKYYSHKLKRLVKCCKSNCRVTDIKDLLVCHYCFDKAFEKFYDIYTATWKGAGFSTISGSICCEDHFMWHRMNCLNADAEGSSYIVKNNGPRGKPTQLSDFIF